MRTRLLAFVAVCGATVAVAACSRASSAPKASPTPNVPTPETVIGQWVRDNRNVDYLGNCQVAKQGVDIGKLCVSVAGTRGKLRAYNLGPTFSDPTALAMVEQQKDGTWKLLSVTNNDPSAGNVPGIAWPLEVGDQVVVVGLAENDCLRIHETPSQTGKQSACEPQGATGIVQEGPTQAESFTWWRIAGNGPGGAFNGWAVDKWLRLPSALQQVLQPNGPPKPTATATAKR
ncbi:MAG: hypothetical protein IVW36_09930 [Dehalococcoidia bacterium]|nr:hypothetical protein [Dehalococcoidia bacterium]